MKFNLFLSQEYIRCEVQKLLLQDVFAKFAKYHSFLTGFNYLQPAGNCMWACNTKNLQQFWRIQFLHWRVLCFFTILNVNQIFNSFQIFLAHNSTWLRNYGNVFLMIVSNWQMYWHSDFKSHSYVISCNAYVEFAKNCAFLTGFTVVNLPAIAFILTTPRMWRLWISSKCATNALEDVHPVWLEKPKQI